MSKLLDDHVVEYASKHLKKIGKDALLGRKLQAVISAKRHGISQVAKIYDISRTTLTSWIKHLRNEALDKLKAPPERKKKSILNDLHRKQIKGWIEQDNQLTIDKVQQKIKEQFQLSIGRSTVHREMKKLGLSYITARPKHFKQNADQVSEFKKISVSQSKRPMSQKLCSLTKRDLERTQEEPMAGLIKVQDPG